MNKTSLKKLHTCDPRLILLATEVNKRYPIQVTCGRRDKREQEEAFAIGTSRVHFPDSKHNINEEEGRLESHAMDIVPDPDKNPATLDWRATKEFYKMLLVVEQVAKELGIKIRLGRDFKNHKGKPLVDLPHVELVLPKP